LKKTFTIVIASLLVHLSSAQTGQKANDNPDPSKKIYKVEAACGKCLLGLSGRKCNLAIRINGKAYYVDGAVIDGYGNAHARHGFCKEIRMAEVQGEIVDNRFKLSYFKILPVGNSKGIN
jgi:hypothetical protein